MLKLFNAYYHDINDNFTHKLSISKNKELLETKLSDISIMTSHNSYIQTTQNFSIASIDAIDIVLKSGARFIELDIFRDLFSGDLFVAHGKELILIDIIVTTRLDLEDVFKFLEKNAFKNTDDPLFISFEFNIHNDKIACNKIINLIEKYFKSRLYRSKISGETLMCDLIDKIILFSGKKNLGKLSNLINIMWNDENDKNNIFYNKSSDINPLHINHKNTRVYSAVNLYSIISGNYDPIPFLKNGVSFVAMNMCMNDNNLKKYIKWYGDYSFKKKQINF